ncbi:MAG: hypothetical protein ABI904_19490 [Chloroflexota bacterium]
MRLCSYMVKYDTGLAPNPFWGYCTLAVCTPNHMGIRLNKNDWIVGVTIKARGNKLLYAMKISEVLSFNEYYSDNRFESKKPVIGGEWMQKVGDNMYYLDEKGIWKQHRTIYHREIEIKKKDLKHPLVFISKEFFYFGRNALNMPHDFGSLVINRQGCKLNHNETVVDNFIKWLYQSFEYGVYGNPYDSNEESK